jgi:hypothetical protein
MLGRGGGTANSARAIRIALPLRLTDGFQVGKDRGLRVDHGHDCARLCDGGHE